MTPSLEVHSRHPNLGGDVAPLDGGFAVSSGGRIALTPAGRPLILPTEPLARLIAAEFPPPGKLVVPAGGTATRLAQAAIDRTQFARAETASQIALFADHDLLCYLADAPAELVANQNAAWTPLRDWARSDLTLEFVARPGIVHRPQPPETLVAVERFALGLDEFTLTGLAVAAQLLGSAILALALMKGRLGGVDAFATSQIDEIYQARTWGEDAEAAARAEAMTAEAMGLAAWFAALR